MIESQGEKLLSNCVYTIGLDLTKLSTIPFSLKVFLEYNSINHNFSLPLQYSKNDRNF